MAGETEAETLLRAGNLYLRRAGFRGVRGVEGLLFAGVKHGGWSLYLDDEPHLHLDLEGRWQRAFRAGVHYRKGLDGQVVAMDRDRSGGAWTLGRRRVEKPQADVLEVWVRETLERFRIELRECLRERLEPAGAGRALDVVELISRLDRALRWDEAAWERQHRLWADVYAPAAFVPADATQAVLVQATIGERGGTDCWGRETEALRVRSSASLVDHLREIRTLHGRRLSQARSVFLAGPDALLQPFETVAAWLEAIRLELPMGTRPMGRPSERPEDDVALSGVECFVCGKKGVGHKAENWGRLRSLGLTRVTVGLPPGTGSEREWVQGLKQAGIAVGVVARTVPEEGGLLRLAERIARLPLERGDRVLIEPDPHGRPADATDLLARLSGLRRAGVVIAASASSSWWD